MQWLTYIHWSHPLFSNGNKVIQWLSKNQCLTKPNSAVHYPVWQLYKLFIWILIYTLFFRFLYATLHTNVRVFINWVHISEETLMVKRCIYCSTSKTFNYMKIHLIFNVISKIIKGRTIFAESIKLLPLVKVIQYWMFRNKTYLLTRVLKLLCCLSKTLCVHIQPSYTNVLFLINVFFLQIRINSIRNRTFVNIWYSWNLFWIDFRCIYSRK